MANEWPQKGFKSGASSLCSPFSGGKKSQRRRNATNAIHSFAVWRPNFKDSSLLKDSHERSLCSGQVSTRTGPPLALTLTPKCSPKAPDEKAPMVDTGGPNAAGTSCGRPLCRQSRAGLLVCSRVQVCGQFSGQSSAQNRHQLELVSDGSGQRAASLGSSIVVRSIGGLL